MNIKRYFAPDTRRAINMVRAEHGPDAVILSSESVEGGVEIIAAVDYDQGLMTLLSGRSGSKPAAEAGTEKDAADADSHWTDDVAPAAADPAPAEASIAAPDAAGITGPAAVSVAAFDDASIAGPVAASITAPAAPTITGPAAASITVPADARVASPAPETAEPTGLPVAAGPEPITVVTATDSTDAGDELASAPNAELEPARAKEPTPDQAHTAGATATTMPGPAATHGLDAESARELRAIQRDLFALKGLVRERIAWADMRGMSPQRRWLMRRAESFGLTPELADTLVSEVEHPDQEDRAWRELVFALARRITVMREDPMDQGGVIALVGPTGVGKTTTIAKLAARQCLREGSHSLALLTTDSNRIGAHRQLEAFGAILGVPVRRADTPEELSEKLRELGDRRLILIDTAGAAPRDAAIAQLLRRLDKDIEIRQFLVLAANMQASVMRDAVNAFGGRQLSGAVLTKLDEANGLGAAVSVLIDAGLPAVWISEGQRIPEDLRLARVANLLKRATAIGESDAERGLPLFVGAAGTAEQIGGMHATAH